MKELLSILLLLAVAPLSTSAQHPNNADSVRSAAAIALTLGPAHTQINDRTVSPIRSDGFVTSGSIRYEIEGGEEWHRIELGGSFGQITNRYDLPAAVGGLHLGYRYLHRLGGDGRSGWRYDAGASLTGSTSIQFYYLLDESHLYWLTAHELAARGMASHALGATGSISVELALPLVSLLSRPPEHRYYNNDIPDVGEVLDLVHSDLKFVSPLDYPGFDLAVAYGFDISERLRESITYRASYRYSSEPVRGEFLSHALHLGLSYRL